MATVKGSRRDKAAATRRAILRAAHGEFLAHGFHGATVTAIAKRAKVAPQTVYFVFNTKSALISAVIDESVVGPDAEDPEASRWFGELLAEPDPVRAIGRWVEGAAPIYERSAGISEVLRAAALTDDEVRRTYQRHEDLHTEGFRVIVESLAAKAPLREGLDVDRATDVATTLLGDSTWHRLRTQRGWSVEQVVGWLREVLPTALLADPSPPRRARVSR